MMWDAYNEEVRLTCVSATTQTEMFTQVSLLVARHEHEDWFFEVGAINYDPLEDPSEPFTCHIYWHRG